ACIVIDEVCRTNLLIAVGPDPAMLERKQGLAPNARRDLDAQLLSLRKTLLQLLQRRFPLLVQAQLLFLGPIDPLQKPIGAGKLCAGLANFDQNPPNQRDQSHSFRQDEISWLRHGSQSVAWCVVCIPSS